MGAAQIILRDTEDGRVEVMVRVVSTPPAEMSKAVLGYLFSALGEVADTRTIGEGLASGARVITDKLLILQPGESILLSEPAHCSTAYTLATPPGIQ